MIMQGYKNRSGLYFIYTDITIQLIIQQCMMTYEQKYQASKSHNTKYVRKSD